MTHNLAPTADAGTRALLQSVVEVAKAIFGAAASSVFLLDEPAGELVFQAVAGEGEDFLVGTRMPANRGIAGWVVSSGQAMIADDLAANRSFARDLAESTKYVPQALMAAPLLSDDDVLGVLQVLDPAQQCRSDLGDLDLLSLFANQAATAIRVAQPCPRCTEPSASYGPQLVDEFLQFLRQKSA
ncbi:GAF domain-containing protein [Fodinicola feengrottensis]|uniref:GAF domain-containing protein n=1 Tax=Fodinicola feengrottensis TaxID=435914 RepID=A0ABN2G293_9ACTN|nr:GAF domain-containing protein [Fodinicola feengrottensis]